MGSGAFWWKPVAKLASHLVAAGAVPATRRSFRRQDALEHAPPSCRHALLCGIDRNPFAVEMARLSLWLATLARDHEFTFLDHALRHGDALIPAPRPDRRFALVGTTRLSAVSLPADPPRIARAAVERRRIARRWTTRAKPVLRPILAGADASSTTARHRHAICAAWFRQCHGDLPQAGAG